LDYSEFGFLGSRVIGANMQCKLFIALQLEVAHLFIERCAGERTGLFKLPPTVGATKTPKTLLLNPYQLPAHGPPMRPDCCGRCVKGRAEFTMRQFGESVGHPTYMEDPLFVRNTCIICRVFEDRLCKAKASKPCSPASARIPKGNQSATNYFYRSPIATTALFVLISNTSACLTI